MAKKTLLILINLFFLLLTSTQAQNVLVKQTNEQTNIGNGLVELSFANEGNEYKLLEMTLNDTKLASNSSTHPWVMTYRGPNGESPAFIPRNGYYKGLSIQKNTTEVATLAFTWEMLIGADKTYPVRMLVTVHKDSPLVEWNIEADVPQGWIVTELDFPRISINKPAQAKAILSAGWGSQYNLGDASKLSSRYPSGTGTMQMALVHDDKECFYYASNDKGGSDKRYTIESSAKEVLFKTTIITSDGWTPAHGGTFRLPWATLTGYHKEGWQQAVVDWYRPFTYTTEWGSKTLESRKLPNWIYNADMWIRPMHVNDEVMDAVRQSLKTFGTGVGVHWYYWHHHPFDTKYPEYFPVKEKFLEMVKETNQLGGHITPYINGRLWDPATKSYQAERGVEASSRKADGTLYTEVYSSKVINTVTCPASDIWRNIQKKTIERIQVEVGTSGVYIDQVAAAPSEPCWADNHGHPKGGGEFWHEAYRSLYKEIRANHLKDNNILTSEENAECYIDLFDMLLIVNSPLKTSKLVPLFPLVYSDRVITSAFAYTPSNITTGYFSYLNMMSMLWGAQLGWVDPLLLVKEGSKEEVEFLKKMVDFRKKHHEYFNGGRFLGELKLTGDVPSKNFDNMLTDTMVKGAKWKSSQSDKTITILINIDHKEHIVNLPNGKAVKLPARQCISIK